MKPTGPLDRMAGAHDAAVLEVARHGEPVSRAGLAAALQVTPQAISKILSRLGERGLIEEAGSVSSGPGKPTTLYQIVPGSRRAIGLHLTRSRVHGVVADLTGQVLERREVGIDRQLPVPELIGALAALARELAEHGNGHLLGVGVGMPGPVDSVEGVYRGAPAPDDAWQGASLRSLLLEELGLPVLLDHDSRAALVGESWSQPGLLDNAALVLAEDGLGAALRLDGAMVRGAHSRAGEVGHTVVRMGGVPCPCGRRGCAQAEYLAALETSDAERAAQVLATVVLNLVRLVDVDRVVLGGRSIYTHHATTMEAVRAVAEDGLGAALRLDGAMVRGAHSRAGEVGHTVVRMGGVPCPCGRRGCAQAEYLAALETADAERAAQVLATVVLNLVRLVDVDRVVLGGRSIYTRHATTMEAVRAALEEGLRAEARLHVEVLLSTRGIDLIAAGAACEVLEHEYGLPTTLVGPGPG